MTSLLAVLLTGCTLPAENLTGNIVGQGAVVSVETNGIVNAQISSNGTESQVVQASGSSAVKGSSVAFPPGSLGIDTTVTLQQGSSVATGSAASALGVDASALVAASQPLSISSGVPTDAVSPFQVALPISSGGALALLGYDTLHVFYTVRKVSLGKTVTGVLPPSAISVTNGVATFSTSHFGVFQLAYLKVALKEVKETDTANVESTAETDTSGSSTTTKDQGVVTLPDLTPPQNPRIVIDGDVAATSSSSVQLSFEAEDAIDIYVTDDSSCSTGGVWQAFQGGPTSWTLSGSNRDVYVFAKFRDAAGNETSCVSDSILHDDTPPTIANVSLASALTNSTSTAPSAAWTTPTDALSAVSVVQYAIGVGIGDGSVVPWTTAATSPLTVSGLSLGASGTFYFSVRAADVLGNLSAPVAAAWTVDTIAPTSPIVTSHANFERVYQPSEAIQGTCEVGSTLTLSASGQASLSSTSVTCSGSGLWQVTMVFFTEGQHTLSAHSVDAASNSSTALNLTLTYDNPTTGVGCLTPPCEAMTYLPNSSFGGATVPLAPTFNNATVLKLTDVDNDDDLDLLVLTSSNQGGRKSFLNAFDTNFVFGTGYAGGIALAVGDLNGDRYVDAVIAGATMFHTAINAGGTFPNAVVTTSFGSSVADVDLGDFNEDGFLDLVVCSSVAPQSKWYAGTGTGAFDAGHTLTSNTSYCTKTDVVDFNNDGHQDIVFARGVGQISYVLFGTGTGTFPTSTPLGSDTGAYSIATGDVNRDGYLDVLIGRSGILPRFYVFNSNNSTFTAAQTVGASTDKAVDINVSDFNADGHIDLIIHHFHPSTPMQPALFMGQDDSGSTMFPASSTAVSNGAINNSALATGDINGDGLADIVRSSASANIFVTYGSSP